MIITSENLRALRTGFNASFQRALGAATSMQARVATPVPSTTKSNTYGWMGKIPGMREWVGPRQIMSLSESGYVIVNKPYEQTIGVDRDDIEDDNLGIYAPLFSELGEGVAAHPDILVFSLLKNGFTTECFDGQNFFDTDHPVIGDDGETVGVYANTDGGATTPWFLLSTRRVLKPLIFQERKKPQFVALDNPDDPNVFHNKQYLYGTDARWNVGFGFPQMAWGSKQTLDATHYATARAAISGFKGDGGRPLGLVPDLLVVPPSLESAGRKLLNSEYGAGGETNEWKGTAELLVVPWLA